MGFSKLFVWTALLLQPWVISAQKTDHPVPVTLAIGQEAPDFNLKATDGKKYSLKSFSKATALVVVFSANHCPTAQAYEDRIMDIARDYKSKGAAVVMISSNDIPAISLSELGYTELSDSYEEMIIRHKDKKFNFPYLYDGDDQKTALAYGPVATPHVFVFDAKRILKYTGRIDASEKPGTAHGEDLRKAIDAVIAGEEPNPATTKVFGCSMKWSWKREQTIQQYKKWAAAPVSMEEIDLKGVKELLQNNTSKLRLINVWATWCGPCVMEFPDLVSIDRMYRRRNFEFISISTDKMDKKEQAFSFLKEQEAANKNFIYKELDIYQLIEAIDPKWQGAVPYTLLVEPGGKIVYSQQGAIDPLQIKKMIVDHPLIGRIY